MLWEGIRLYSRSQYQEIGPESRFILTDTVREKLHPDIPETYLNKSIILIETNKTVEIEVEGSNFLVVDDAVSDFTIISMREAERRYPKDITECRLTGSSLIAKLFQDEQETLMAKPKRSRIRRTPTAEKKPEKSTKAAPATKEPKKAPVKKKEPEPEPKEKPARKPAPKKTAEPETPVEKEEPQVKKKAAVRSGTGIISIWKRK